MYYAEGALKTGSEAERRWRGQHHILHNDGINQEEMRKAQQNGEEQIRKCSSSFARRRTQVKKPRKCMIQNFLMNCWSRTSWWIIRCAKSRCYWIRVQMRMMESESLRLRFPRDGSRRRRSDWWAQELATFVSSCWSWFSDVLHRIWGFPVTIEFSEFVPATACASFVPFFWSMWLHTPCQECKAQQQCQIHFCRVMTPSLTPVRPGRWLTLVDIPWVCHCHCHCHWAEFFTVYPRRRRHRKPTIQAQGIEPITIKEMESQTRRRRKIALMIWCWSPMRATPNEHTIGSRPRRKRSNAPRPVPPWSTNHQLTTPKSRQGDARPSSATSNRGRGQKEAPPDCAGLPRHRAHALFGHDAFLSCAVDSAVGQSGLHPQHIQRRASSRVTVTRYCGPPHRGRHHGWGHILVQLSPGSPVSRSRHWRKKMAATDQW